MKIKKEEMERIEMEQNEFFERIDSLTKQEMKKIEEQFKTKKKIKNSIFKKICKDNRDLLEMIEERTGTIIMYDDSYGNIFFVDDRFRNFILSKQVCIDMKNLFEKLSKIC